MLTTVPTLNPGVLHGARGPGGFVYHRSPMCQSSNSSVVFSMYNIIGPEGAFSTYDIIEFRIEGGYDDI